uniref:Uncharacterized protein n=1 Tax=Chromera velia CCMP2878 TaxID=1169474 RepID=A0A0G4HYX9_9ALVE|mmetsp:Transcript_28949/g.56645  ORF Transcript_28949/g.56645 Transcript_28949/m.56645 type:complete len:321 (+) Transcript_28949:192-1154(+)|eukprot:Cvel_9599.t1-p1 / transcript=Cvel_9599.t1 / gene=Cvel_9599 / organism=Chromera_velia_CCMP2878 / gene_product=hypothetical protein / transcript_product=hypothetical protein / location=Cvel_scaffold557:51913-54910(+) / protein_length=320 / sequence_SO=supercontig / SO=protein_coding / is_pseudo=false
MADSGPVKEEEKPEEVSDQPPAAVPPSQDETKGAVSSSPEPVIPSHGNQTVQELPAERRVQSDEKQPTGIKEELERDDRGKKRMAEEAGITSASPTAYAAAAAASPTPSGATASEEERSQREQPSKRISHRIAAAAIAAAASSGDLVSSTSGRVRTFGGKRLLAGKPRQWKLRLSRWDAPVDVASTPVSSTGSDKTAAGHQDKRAHFSVWRWEPVQDTEDPVLEAGKRSQTEPSAGPVMGGVKAGPQNLTVKGGPRSLVTRSTRQASSFLTGDSGELFAYNDMLDGQSAGSSSLRRTRREKEQQEIARIQALTLPHRHEG